jgi:hypothetical protein
MSRRILIALPVALAIGLAFSVQSAMAIKVGDPGFAAVQTSSKPIVSEKLTGLFPATHASAQLIVPGGVNMTPAQYRTLALRSEGLDRLYGSVNTVSSSRPVASEISTGLRQPSSHIEPVLVSNNDDGFNWSDAGIGAGALFGTMLLGAAGALTLRRHRGTLAH